MKIGELAKQTGTPIETIRFYEREFLLPEPARSDANYRQYNAHHAERLRFIRHCRSLDMALDEVRVLLRFKDAPSEHCGEVNNLLDEHIRHVAERIDELKSLEVTLKALRKQCRREQDAQHCGILLELSESDEPVASRRSRRHVHGSHR